MFTSASKDFFGELNGSFPMAVTFHLLIVSSYPI